jgi:hypothetical protein
MSMRPTFSANLARLGGVSRARITQIMNLRLLAPDIQEKLLFHERVHSDKDTVKLRDLQAVALEADWGRQKIVEIKYTDTLFEKPRLRH